MESTPLSGGGGGDGDGNTGGQLSWQHLLQVSKDHKVTEDSFHSICKWVIVVAV